MILKVVILSNSEYLKSKKLVIGRGSSENEQFLLLTIKG